MRIKKHIHFEFNQDLVKEPLLYHLNRRYADVETNIRGAQVGAEGGFMVLEVEGEEDEIAQVLDYLAQRGIQVNEGIPKSEEQ